MNKADTPEWKRKLAQGDDITSDGFDLFAPSKLEGMFQAPPAKPEKENESTLLEGLSKPWDSYRLPSAPSLSDHYQSLRTSRSRLPGMEVLQEVDEENDAERAVSAISSDLVRNGSVRGMVHKRVQSLERLRDDQQQSSPPPTRPSTATGLESADDPRWRTFSGRQEIENEYISPITASRQNTIRDKVLKVSTEVDTEALDRKLAEIGLDERRRPPASSSDREVSYLYSKDHRTAELADPHIGDITSQSLPDDLSMGTQDFISQGGYINQRRGAPSGEVSVLKPRQSSLTFSQLPQHPKQTLPSSPPSFHNIDNRPINDALEFVTLPDAAQDDRTGQLQDTSVVHHEEPPELRPKSSGSPLKLFGNRDTYTNNKLLRILSQFDGSKYSEDFEGQYASIVADQSQSALRVSHFGQGDLENFNFAFEKQLSLSPQERRELELNGSPIFKTQHVLESAVLTQITKPQAQRDAKAQSPLRTPKRRRTLLKDEINVDNQQLEIKIDQVQDTNLLAGTKRKDARPGDAGMQAEADVLASRTLLHPTTSRRSSSTSKIPQLTQTAGVRQSSQEATQEVAEALAAELASFAQEAAHVQNDSRKPSLATKDYMEEANKVMQFIRNRGKPQPALPEIQEPEDQSELDPDRILDLDIDDESTKEEFSRPPSREGPRRTSPDRRRAVHDPKTASYLRKYQEDDDLELLANTSGLGTLKMVDNRAAQEASQVPVPEDSDHDEQESSPPNMRILNPAQSLRKRKHSASTVEDQGSAQVQTMGSSGGFTQGTFPSSSSSGHKGIITSGTVSIPDQVGKMTYDHQQQRWVPAVKAHQERKRNLPSVRTANSEADPFEHIPDLSIDEKLEEEARHGSRPSTMDSKMKHQVAQAPSIRSDVGPFSKSQVQQLPVEKARSRADSEAESNNSSLRSQASKHEARLHDGLASRPPTAPSTEKKQPRVVTIAFSSPVVSAVQYPDDLSDIDDEINLPLDDSELSCTPQSEVKKAPKSQSNGSAQKYEHYRAMTLSRRPVSRIDEHDEDQPNGEMSLIHVKQAQEMTPVPKPQHRQLIKHQQKKGHNSSILCLTPLSDFTVHQMDSARHPEESFVEERANPKALRQAHGSLALQVDTLVKAITDEEPSEIYWERILKMRLEGKGLTSLHGLVDYCSGLEQLSVANNQISHLNGLPSALRVLNMNSNVLTSLASWGQLLNLQYLDVSGNQLESLGGFNCLIHLRKLVANDNAISSIEGVLELDGLLELQVRGNNLAEIDFENSDLDRLRKLDLSNNQLKAVRNLHQLISLEELDLSQNKLGSMPLEEEAAAMNSLVISSNQIADIDLGLLPTVRSLIADRNNIRQVAGLRNAYNLETLSLRSQSGISDLVSSILSTPNECRILALSSNAVPGGVVARPQLPQCNLRELELVGCGISELPLGFGDFFPNCRQLNLNYNAIKDILVLQGMLKLSKLDIARNRILRMRRTCLALAKLPKLAGLDLRDNPLTIGFYSPVVAERGDNSQFEAYSLPSRDDQDDVRWLDRLDETTQLKRRAVELLLAQGCASLTHLDGMTFRSHAGHQSDLTWNTLTQKRVLLKPTASTEGQQGDEEESLPLHIDEAIDMSAMMEERSLMIE